MAFLNDWLLTIVLLLPLAGTVAVLIVRKPVAVYWIAFGTTLAEVILALLMLIPLHGHRTGSYAYGPAGTVQMLVESEWIPVIHAGYRVALDGLGFLFVVITTIVCAVACAASWPVNRKPVQYFALMLLFEFTILGMLLSFDLLMLTLCAGLSIVPAYLLIARWGRADAHRAAVRLLMYLGGGFVCLLVATICVNVASRQFLPGGTFDLVALSSSPIALGGRVVFLLALAGCAVRLGIIPSHGWLPGMLAEASPAVAMLIAGLIPLTGGYALLRVAWPLFSHAAESLWPLLVAIALGTMLIGGLCALAQVRLGTSIAYSAVSSAGMVLLGVASLTTASTNGVAYVLLGQCLIVSLLAILNGFLLDRQMEDETSWSGLATAAPVFTAFFSVAWLAQLILPGLLGSFIVIVGVFQVGPPHSTFQAAGIAMIAALMIPLNGAVVVRNIRRLFAGSVPPGVMLADVKALEAAAIAPLAVLVLCLGAFPGTIVFAFATGSLQAILKMNR
jgi:NADH-quinone oxidoreductase subunit M